MNDNMFGWVELVSYILGLARKPEASKQTPSLSYNYLPIMDIFGIAFIIFRQNTSLDKKHKF